MKVACAVMQKDEDLLLDGWCRHHGYLFGYENLWIFDHGSTKEPVLEILDRYQRLGCNIVKHHNKIQDYKNKGEILAKLFRRLQEYCGYDFMIPLDCDEFLSVSKNGKISFAKKDILEELGLYVRCPDTIKISYEFANSLKYPGYFCHKAANKTVFASPYFRRMDTGYHKQGTDTNAFTQSNLVHIHYHNKPFERTLEDSKRKLRNHGVTNFDPDYLDTLNFSMHLAPYFRMTEETFLESQSNKCHWPVKSFSQWMQDLGVTAPFLIEPPNGKAPPILFPDNFDGSAYMAANPDVAKTNMSADAHYSIFGIREGRKATARVPTDVV